MRAGMELSRGVVYIAFGDRCLREADHSANSLALYCPELPRLLITDSKVAQSCFDEVWVRPMRHIRAKIDYLAETPFQDTLYMDSDTEVRSNLREMFQILDRFDIALTHDFARRRNYLALNIPEYESIPYAFPEMNGGLMLYRNNERVQRFLALWRQYFYRYQSVTNGWDQPTLRIALWQSEVRLHALPVEYNVRNLATRKRAAKRAALVSERGLLEPRILHWKGLNAPKWWHPLSPKYRRYRY